MPLTYRGRGGAAGGGFDLGPSPNSFGTVATADMAAARALLDAQASGDAAWLALYDANRSNYVRLVWTGNASAVLRRNAAADDWENVTGVVVGPPGLAGTPGAAGGGAFESTGIILDLTGVTINTDVLMSTGLMLGERGETPIVPYRLEANAAAWLIIDADRLYDLPVRAVAGNDVSNADATRNAFVLPESAGSSLSGTVRGGLSADNELLIAFSANDSDTYVEFGRYVPSAVQGGLTDAERAKLDGIEADATADQSGDEIKTAYEAEDNTNAFDDAAARKLGGISAGANLLTPYKLGNIYRAVASGTIPDKPGNNEGVATFAGITVAPNEWVLVRPGATAALSDVFDCHVYGYVTNGVFGVQYGTPNRTDRYNPFVADDYAAVAGTTFLGETGGLTPVNPSNFATKEYVDAGDSGTPPPSPRSEEIYYGLLAAAAEAATVDVSTLDMADATVAGHELTLGPSAAGQFFVILVPTQHDLLTLVNTGTQANALGAYTRVEDARDDLGTPTEQYTSYTLGPLNVGVTITYRLTLAE